MKKLLLGIGLAAIIAAVGFVTIKKKNAKEENVTPVLKKDDDKNEFFI